MPFFNQNKTISKRWDIFLNKRRDFVNEIFWLYFIKKGYFCITETPWSPFSMI